MDQKEFELTCAILLGGQRFILTPEVLNLFTNKVKEMAIEKKISLSAAAVLVDYVTPIDSIIFERRTDERMEIIFSAYEVIKTEMNRHGLNNDLVTALFAKEVVSKFDYLMPIKRSDNIISYNNVYQRRLKFECEFLVKTYADLIKNTNLDPTVSRAKSSLKEQT